MWANRLNLRDEPVAAGQGGAAAFVMVPAGMPMMLSAAQSPQQIYQWAFERARQEVGRQAAPRCPELFANMN